MAASESRRRGRALRGDRGFVTAEAAMALPVLVLFATALVWALLAVCAQIQCVDAARVGARAAARQDPQGAVMEATRRAAPDGARVGVGREGDYVRVTVSSRSPGPGLMGVDLSHDAVALAEETVGVSGG